MEEQIYTREDLVNFGSYLLSTERTKLISSTRKGKVDKKEALKYVYDADIANFEFLFKTNLDDIK